MLKLKVQYFGHLMWRTDSLKKTLLLGMIEGRRTRGLQRLRWLDGITNWMGMSLNNSGVGDGQGGLACCSPWHSKKLHLTERLNWTVFVSCSVFQVFWNRNVFYRKKWNNQLFSCLKKLIIILLFNHGEGNGNPHQYSCLENSMDRGAWLATVHGIAELDMTE